MFSMRTIVSALALYVCVNAAPPKRFKYYDMITPLSGPCDLTTGPDGAIWVSDFLAPLIARVDPVTGDVEEFEIPYKGPIIPIQTPELVGRATLACVIQPGEDGNMYAATGIRNEFARLNPKTKKIDVFSTGNPLGNLEPFNDMWRGKRGMFFTQTTANTITRFDYKTEKMKNYHPPTPASGPLGIYRASDGAFWFCEFFANQIGRLNATTGEIVEYPIILPDLLLPAVMRAETKEPNGQGYLWFTGLGGNSMGRIDMKTGEVKAYPHPVPLAFPTEDTVDGKGNVWYSTLNSNSLNKLNTTTGKVTIIKQPGTIAPLPGGIPPAVDIAMHYGPGNDMWFTELARNRVGRYRLNQ